MPSQYTASSFFLQFLLDQLRFCVSNGTDSHCEGEGINEEGLNQHGLKGECLGVLPPRLLQGHSPSGDPHCTALV